VERDAPSIIYGRDSEMSGSRGADGPRCIKFRPTHNRSRVETRGYRIRGDILISTPGIRCQASRACHLGALERLNQDIDRVLFRRRKFLALDQVSCQCNNRRMQGVRTTPRWFERCEVRKERRRSTGLKVEVA